MRSISRTMFAALLAVLAIGAVSAAPALASGKPTVETKPATGVGEHEARLNGVVNPNGEPTKYYFEYWREVEGIKYEKTKTAELSAESRNSNVEVSAALTGLKAEMEYHFLIRATNALGTSEGALLEFATSAAAGLPEFNKFNAERNKGFTLKGASAVGFKERGGSAYGCTASSGTGEVTGAKTATVSLTFKGCGDSGINCTTTGHEAGDIVTGSLPAQLRYISKEKREVGLVVNFHKTDFAAWWCAGTEAGIHGSIIVPITPVNTATTSFTMNFAGKEGIQQPTSFEGVEGKGTAYPTMSLLGGSYLEGSLEAAMALTTVEKAEVKA